MKGYPLKRPAARQSSATETTQPMMSDETMSEAESYGI